MPRCRGHSRLGRGDRGGEADDGCGGRPCAGIPLRPARRATWYVMNHVAIARALHSGGVLPAPERVLHRRGHLSGKIERELFYQRAMHIYNR